MTDPIQLKHSGLIDVAAQRITKVLKSLFYSIVRARQLQADNYIKHLSSVRHVREYANQVERSDPRFAADLRAAADRAELQTSEK